MAISPPPISDVINQLNSLLGDSGLKGELDRNMKTVLQSALGKLDVVSREEFDAQAAVLARTRARVEQLEAELQAMIEKVDSQT